MTTGSTSATRPLTGLAEAEAVLVSLAEAMEQRDSCTRGHCDRLAVFGVALGMAMKLPQEDVTGIHRGAYLHDIGKIGVPDAILQKPGALTAEEWRVMQAHTSKGEAICRPLSAFERVLPIIRSHHERWDGSGYPDGLRGVQTPLLARVLQLADIFDALTSDRPYKTALSVSDALDVMRLETRKGWRDPELMRIFESLPHEGILRTARRQAGYLTDIRIAQESLLALSAAILRH